MKYHFVVKLHAKLVTFTHQKIYV